MLESPKPEPPKPEEPIPEPQPEEPLLEPIPEPEPVEEVVEVQMTIATQPEPVVEEVAEVQITLAPEPEPEPVVEEVEQTLQVEGTATHITFSLWLCGTSVDCSIFLEIFTSLHTLSIFQEILSVV